jgi:ferritin heavy chain
MSADKKNNTQQGAQGFVTPNQPKENLVRYNYHEDNEGLINRQINLELYASYVYMAMAYHFDRADVAFKGHHEFFEKMSKEEHEHAEKLMEYQNKRGGTIVLVDIKKPGQQSWGSPLEAHEMGLQLEKDVYQALLELHASATKQADPHLTNYLEEEFIEEQVKSIYKYACYITNLRRVGAGLGEYIFDKHLD